MHCSANVGLEGDVAFSLVLSGTGKTTLSADPNRRLIGDDEHGWSKMVYLISKAAATQNASIYHEKKNHKFSMRSALVPFLKMLLLIDNSQNADYDDGSLTENTRAAYPIQAIDNIVDPSIAGHPNTIVFLTADAFGVLPPIAN